MSMSKTPLLAIVALALTGLAASQTAQTPTPAVTRRTPQLENESVRVWKSVSPPASP